MGRRDHGDYGGDHSNRRDKQCEFGNRFHFAAPPGNSAPLRRVWCGACSAPGLMLYRNKLHQLSWRIDD
jgi:hypothetical protein